MPAILAQETIRTLFAPDARAAGRLRDALAACGYSAELRPEGNAFVVAYLAAAVGGSSVLRPCKGGA